MKVASRVCSKTNREPFWNELGPYGSYLNHAPERACVGRVVKRQVFRIAVL